MQNLAEKSAQKSELLRYYSDAVESIAVLHASLKYTEEFVLKLQEKLDSRAAEYIAEKRVLEQAKDAVMADNDNLIKEKNDLLEKNKRLRQKEAGEYSLLYISEYFLYPFCC